MAIQWESPLVTHHWPVEELPMPCRLAPTGSRPQVEEEVQTVVLASTVQTSIPESPTL